MLRLIWICLLLACLLLTPALAPAQETDPGAQPENKWSMTLLSGLFSGGNMGDIIKARAHHTNNSWIAGVGLSRKLFNITDHLNAEIEGQVVRHFDHTSHWDITGLIIFRWDLFPWSQHFRTSLAAGWGLSYSTDSHHDQWAAISDPGGLHHYLLFELTLGLPQFENYDLSLRLHHRSPGFSTLGHGISNYACIGISYKF